MSYFQGHVWINAAVTIHTLQFFEFRSLITSSFLRFLCITTQLCYCTLNFNLVSFYFMSLMITTLARLQDAGTRNFAGPRHLNSRRNYLIIELIDNSLWPLVAKIRLFCICPQFVKEPFVENQQTLEHNLLITSDSIDYNIGLIDCITLTLNANNLQDDTNLHMICCSVMLWHGHYNGGSRSSEIERLPSDNKVPG